MIYIYENKFINFDFLYVANEVTILVYRNEDNLHM